MNMSSTFVELPAQGLSPNKCTARAWHEVIKGHASSTPSRVWNLSHVQSWPLCSWRPLAPQPMSHQLLPGDGRGGTLQGLPAHVHCLPQDRGFVFEGRQAPSTSLPQEIAREKSYTPAGCCCFPPCCEGRLPSPPGSSARCPESVLRMP